MVPLSPAQLIEARPDVPVADLRSAGYTDIEIAEANVGIEAMKAAGFSTSTLLIAELRQAGSGRTMSQLLDAKEAGLSVNYVHAAGFSADQVYDKKQEAYC